MASWAIREREVKTEADLQYFITIACLNYSIFFSPVESVSQSGQPYRDDKRPSIHSVLPSVVVSLAR